MQPLLKITLFGNFAVTDAAGQKITVASRRAQALLAYLALRLRQHPRMEEIAQLLFGSTGHAAVASVHGVVAELMHTRDLPQGAFERDGDIPHLNPETVVVDADEFERQLANGSVAALREADLLYEGKLLDGFFAGAEGYDGWIQEERVRYWDFACSALARLLALQIDAGWREAAIETAGKLLAVDPSQEIVHRTLIRLQLEQGRPDAALRRYQECLDIFHRQGIEPGSETHKLHEQIRESLASRPARHEYRKPSGAPVLVMVVEDDLVSATLFEGYLTEAGYEVVTVADGADALIEIGKRKFDLLLLDINIPTLDGLRLFEIMIQKGIETPAIFVTGLSGIAVEVRSMEIGAADFLRKPVQKEMLLSRIRGVLERRDRAAGRS